MGLDPLEKAERQKTSLTRFWQNHCFILYDRPEPNEQFLPESAKWLTDFLDELSSFPSAPHDDCVDALSQALNYARTTEPAMFSVYRTMLDRQKNGEPEIIANEGKVLVDRYESICESFSIEGSYTCPACNLSFAHEPHPHRREGTHQQVDCASCGHNLQWDEPEQGGALTPCGHADRRIAGALVPSGNLGTSTPISRRPRRGPLTGSTHALTP